MFMKPLKCLVLLSILFSLLVVTPLSALTISQLRLQERHFALADFKHIYKQRQHFHVLQTKRLKRQRIKNVSRVNLCNQGAQRGSGRYGHKYGNPKGTPSSNGSHENSNQPPRYYQNNPWAKRH